MNFLKKVAEVIISIVLACLGMVLAVGLIILSFMPYIFVIVAGIWAAKGLGIL